ncbi:FAD-dependent oxidoreductase [Candidatus Roizmanbacteria bacterium]|nr:FAD-dependent oxidoreductase [Candidatus Roizmanbacteria bacterium]
MIEKKILIVGAGFGGIRCALDLANHHLPEIKITLVNPTPHFEYHATLYRLLTGKSALETCIPLRDIFLRKMNIDVVEDFVTDVNFKKNYAEGKSGSKYHYDYLILALGSETAYCDIPGLKDLSFTLKSVNDALRLKQHLHEIFSSHVIVVGGGATGVEIAGELALYTKKLAEHHAENIPLLTIDLITSGERLVPQLPLDLSIEISRRLRELGINLYFNRRVTKEEVGEVFMKDMSIKTKTVIWAAGVEGNELYRKIGLPVNSKSQVIINKYLQPILSKDNLTSNVYIIGDGADTKFSGMAQTALDHGHLVAENINRDIQSQPQEPYYPEEPAYTVPVGNNWAAVSMYGINFYRRVGWWIRRFMQLQFLLSILPFSKAITAWREDGILWESCPVCRGEIY